MSIHNRVHEAYRFKILSEFKENKYLPNTAEGMLEFLFSDNSEYRIYYYEDPYNKTTLGQRLNRLWIIPCWWLIAPFKWILTGSAGVNTHTKFAKWVAKVTGI